MAYRSYKVSTADMENFYLPKRSSYDIMLGSINANGYGQIINNYNGPGSFSVNSYNVWDDAYDSMVVKTPDLGTTFTEAQAGPALWGVDSSVGLQFLQGNVNIEGLAKLKYCNNCEGRNGLPKPTITNFSNLFGSLETLKNNLGQKYGYIFYDYDFTNNQDWYVSAYNTGISKYVFENYLGTQKSEEQVSSETGISVGSITSSLESAEPIIPIVCESLSLSYSITSNDVCSGVQVEYNYDSTNNVLYNGNFCGSQTAAVGYYSDGNSIFYWDNVNFDKFGRCPSNSILLNCCDRSTTIIIPGLYTIGDTLFTIDTRPYQCYQVISHTSTEPDNFLNWNKYASSCNECIAQYSSCKR